MELTGWQIVALIMATQAFSVAGVVGVLWLFYSER